MSSHLGSLFDLDRQRMARHFEGPKAKKRAGFWYFVRRVPKAYTHVDKRGYVFASTGIRVADDPRCIAGQAEVAVINQATELYWKNLCAGRSETWGLTIEKARTVTKKYGWVYRPAAELLQAPLEHVLDRVEALAPLSEPYQPVAAKAILGLAQDDGIRMSQLREWFQEHEHDIHKGKSPKQLQNWQSARDRVIAEFTAVIGVDRHVKSIDRADALTIFEHYKTAIKDGRLSGKSLNAYMIRLRTMVLAYFKYIGLKGINPFEDLTVPTEDDDQRPPFSMQFLKDTMLREGALDRINLEARCILYTMIETGLRPSEICALDEHTIVLNAPIPYARVSTLRSEEGQADGRKRKLKTKNAARDVPLVGVALMALQAFPRGFPRYFDRSHAISELFNTYITKHGLRPTPAHALYSLRHSFKDRMRSVLAPDKLIDQLMGYHEEGTKYGEGYSLEVKLTFMKQIALKAPRRL